MTDWRRVGLGLTLFVAVIVVGTVGYAVPRLHPAATRSTRPSRRSRPFDSAKWSRSPTSARRLRSSSFSSAWALALYTLTVFVETLLEGQLRAGTFGRQRMERRIRDMSGHVIICGWGRVGRVIAREMSAMGREHVVVDLDPARIETAPAPAVLGDATEDSGARESWSRACKRIGGRARR